MKSIEIKGLTFVQTHNSDPVRYDVRDADFKRVAYIELDSETEHLVCTTSGADSIILYETFDNKRCIDLRLQDAANAINDYIKCNRPKTIKAKLWKITGYKGRDDWDGPQDNNMRFTVVMDARFSKEDVQDIFLNRFSKKHRSVVVDATEIACFDVERNVD